MARGRDRLSRDYPLTLAQALVAGYPKRESYGNFGWGGDAKPSIQHAVDANTAHLTTLSDAVLHYP